jgi:phospholipase/lecithinase/hemolysin
MKVFAAFLGLALLVFAPSAAMAASTVGTIGLTLGSAYTDPATKEANITWVHVTGYSWSDTGGFSFEACGYLSQSAAAAGASPIYCSPGNIVAPTSDPLAAIYAMITTALTANSPTTVGSP